MNYKTLTLLLFNKSQLLSIKEKNIGIPLTPINLLNIKKKKNKKKKEAKKLAKSS